MVRMSNLEWRRIRAAFNRVVKAYENFKLTLEDQDRVEDCLDELRVLLEKHSPQSDGKKA